jgi:hypothetical protein
MAKAWRRYGHNGGSMRKVIVTLFLAGLVAAPLCGCADWVEKHDKGTDAEGMFGHHPDLDQQEKEAKDSINAHHE